MTINNFIKDLGYSSVGDFLHSTLHINYSKIITLMSISLGTLATLFEQFIGLTPAVYLSFSLLLFAEFYTGIKASLLAGEKIESSKAQRFILKIGVYTIMIGAMHCLAIGMTPFSIKGIPLNVYEWLYYVILNMIILLLILSVFENGSRLGWKESSRIFRFLSKYIDKWLNLLDE